MVNWPKSSRIRCSDPGRRLITWSLSYDGLSGPAMMAHVYGPAAEGGNNPQKRSTGDLAYGEKRIGPQSDRRASYADSRAGAAIDGRRVVHQRCIRELIRTAKFAVRLRQLKTDMGRGAALFRRITAAEHKLMARIDMPRHGPSWPDLKGHHN